MFTREEALNLWDDLLETEDAFLTTHGELLLTRGIYNTGHRANTPNKSKKWGYFVTARNMTFTPEMFAAYAKVCERHHCSYRIECDKSPTIIFYRTSRESQTEVREIPTSVLSDPKVVLYIITRKGEFVSAVYAPEGTDCENIRNNYLFHLEVAEDTDLHVEEFNPMDWIGYLQNVKTSRMHLSNAFFVRSSSNLHEGITLSGPHVDPPKLKPGQFLFQKDAYGHQFVPDFWPHNSHLNPPLAVFKCSKNTAIEKFGRMFSYAEFRDGDSNFCKWIHEGSVVAEYNDGELQCYDKVDKIMKLIEDDTELA